MNKRVHNLQDLSNLAWLSLSGCPSLSLQSGALLPLTGLRTLHLADLGWTQLDRCNLDCESKYTSRSKNVFECSLSRDLVQWQNLQSLDLAANPLHCDCQLAWLRDVLTAAGSLYSIYLPTKNICIWESQNYL